MNLRNKKLNNHIQSIQNNFQPIIGLFNPISTLTCSINPQLHNFNLVFQHPLQIITKISIKCKKHALQQIISATFDVKIQQKTTFVPQALLTGKYEIIHQYKKMLQNTKIGTYIKLNIRHKQKSYQKKRPLSVDYNITKHINQTTEHRDNLYSKVFNQKTVNQQTTKKNVINNFITINDMKNSYNLKNTYDTKNQTKSQYSQSVNKKDRSAITSRISKFNQENINITTNIKQYRNIHTVNHTHIQNTKNYKSNKMSKAIDGIKINYIAIKGSQQNPQTSTFIYKSTTNKTNRQPSQFGTKTDFLSPNLNKFNKTLHNDLSFSIHNENDKISMHSNIKEHQLNDDNLSEKYEKSIKNSEISQLTHQQIYTKDYFFNDRKILKKGRKSVFVQNFEKKQFY